LGGGGGGGYIRLNLIYSFVYSNVTYTINNITFTLNYSSNVNDGSNTSYSTLQVSYNDVYIVVAAAQNGFQPSNVINPSSSAGGYGGGTSIALPSWDVPQSTYMNVLIAENGPPGGGFTGSQTQNGSSNGYTSSGSGANSKSPYNPCCSPPVAYGMQISGSQFNQYIYSQGGGLNTTSGMGAGGGSIPANYNENSGSYRYGTPGFCEIIF
jgi:hypothetical protein